MRSLLKIVLVFLCIPFWACTESEQPASDFGLAYQPLEIGLFWIYEVSENVIFGENDFESSSFFYRDNIEYTYQNAEDNQVFVLMRQKSSDGINWLDQGNYALQIRDNTLIQTFENQNTVNLVFPPSLGQKWNASIYNANDEDEFSIETMGRYTLDDQEFSNSLKVLREEADDEITFRDKRYAVYEKGVGLIEEYHEVYSYCSRNDCLGQQILDSGRLTHLKILEYGKK
jgi:hypothetical protein